LIAGTDVNIQIEFINHAKKAAMSKRYFFRANGSKKLPAAVKARDWHADGGIIEIS
jgi:hypothetical protein